MNWKGAIEINKAALIRIVAGLATLVAAQGGVRRLPLPVYQMIARVLLPAESAVRRLIVIAARGLVVALPAVRVLPKGLVIGNTGKGRMAFRLFDSRKAFGSFEEETGSTAMPGIRLLDDLSPRAIFMATFDNHPAVAGTISEVETMRLTSRLEAVRRALETLPRQARRMARWRARRAALETPKFTSPLRPGPAPGRNKRSRDEIQLLLRECHALARHALAEDTS
jgi:hypothetical protein